MDSRHKNKATIGLVVWTIAMLLAICALAMCGKFAHQSGGEFFRAAAVIFFVVSMLVQYVAYFWGGSHLAKAKGYSNAMLIFGIIPPVQMLVLSIILFALPDKCGHRKSSGQGRKQGGHKSQISQVVRYRRNALVANAAGLAGILIALILVFWPAGLFDTHDNARVAAIFVFLPSYTAVLSGCWWWVRAKGWPDAVIFIGLLPLAVLLIPYVRLIYQAAPMLFPAGMVIMPVILLSVIAVLPDKSGMPKRRR